MEFNGVDDFNSSQRDSIAQFNGVRTKKQQLFGKLRGVSKRGLDEVLSVMNTLASNPAATDTAVGQVGWMVDQPKLLGQPQRGCLDKTNERAATVTTLLSQILRRQDSVPRWGINE